MTDELKAHLKLLEEAEAEAAAIKAKEKELAGSRNRYPPAVILRYREFDEAGGFKRTIVYSTPISLNEDEVSFDCGHKQISLAPLAKAGEGKLRCRQCIDQWLAAAVAEEKKPK